MKLIKRLPRRLSKNGKNLESWGIFWCNFCKKEVERRLSNGKIAKSCGCVKVELQILQVKGKRKSEEHKQKIREALIGKRKTEEHKQKIRETLTGRIGEKNPNFGKKRTEEQIKNMSESQKGRRAWNKGLKGLNMGYKNGNWNNGSSFEPYASEFNKEFKEFIKQRDNYMCQCPDCEHLSDILDCHHIDYDKTNNISDNVITLCRKCHTKTNGKNNRKYWTEFYQNIMIGKVVECLL